VTTSHKVRDEDPKVYSSDPDPDPDPAQQKNRIRIRIRLSRKIGSGSGSDPTLIRNEKNIYIF